MMMMMMMMMMNLVIYTLLLKFLEVKVKAFPCQMPKPGWV